MKRTIEIWTEKVELTPGQKLDNFGTEVTILSYTVTGRARRRSFWGWRSYRNIKEIQVLVEVE